MIISAVWDALGLSADDRRAIERRIREIAAAELRREQRRTRRRLRELHDPDDDDEDWED